MGMGPGDPDDTQKNQQDDSTADPYDDRFLLPCAFIPYFHIIMLRPDCRRSLGCFSKDTNIEGKWEKPRYV
jgi:hypothetical protein